MTGDSETLVDKGLNPKERLSVCNEKMMKQKLQECTSGTGCTCESKNCALGVFG